MEGEAGRRQKASRGRGIGRSEATISALRLLMHSLMPPVLSDPRPPPLIYSTQLGNYAELALPPLPLYRQQLGNYAELALLAVKLASHTVALVADQSREAAAAGRRPKRCGWGGGWLPLIPCLCSQSSPIPPRSPPVPLLWPFSPLPSCAALYLLALLTPPLRPPLPIGQQAPCPGQHVWGHSGLDGQ